MTHYANLVILVILELTVELIGELFIGKFLPKNKKKHAKRIFCSYCDASVRFMRCLHYHVILYQTFLYFRAFNRFNFPGYKLCWLQSPMHTHQLQKQMQISSSQLVLAKNSKLNWSYLDTDGWNFVFFFHIEFKVEKYVLFDFHSIHFWSIIIRGYPLTTLTDFWDFDTFTK